MLFSEEANAKYDPVQFHFKSEQFLECDMVSLILWRLNIFLVSGPKKINRNQDLIALCTQNGSSSPGSVKYLFSSYILQTHKQQPHHDSIIPQNSNSPMILDSYFETQVKDDTCWGII